MARFMTFMLAVGGALALAGCNPQPPITPLPQPAMQATVDAAVQATGAAQQRTQATIEAAVQATAQASAPTPTVMPAQPTPPPATPSPIVQATLPPMGQYEAMSEEELAAYIDQAVAEAVAETTAASSTASTASSDDAVTQAEYDALAAAINEATAAVFAAESAITAYYDLYGALAAETLAVLQAIEQDLYAMNATLMTLNETLIIISASLQQGVALAEETLAQLEAAAQQAQAAAAAVQTKTQTWLTSVQANLDKRVSSVQAVQPTAIADTAVGALQSANQYLDSLRSVLADKQVAPDELANISAISANAVASLKAVGGAELNSLADSITTMTTQLARGQMPQVQLSLGGFQPPTLPALPKPSR